MTNAESLADNIKAALWHTSLRLEKTRNVPVNLGKTPELVLAEMLIKSGAIGAANK